MLGIRTEPEIPAGFKLDPLEPWKGQFFENVKNHDNFRYSTIGYWYIRRILRVVKPGPEDVFCDLGCGMGRVVCLAAQRPMRKCVGIELQEPLCRIAERNAAGLRGKKAPIQIICGDVATADLSEGTIFFLFNPFGPDTLRETMENIRGSLSQKPRAIKILYYHSKYRYALGPLDWLVPTREFSSFGGQPVTIWENQPAADNRASAERAA